MNKLINELTQKDETKALNAAASIINAKNIEAFKSLCQKSDFLFDFVKRNVSKRIQKVVNKNNFKNLISFFDMYNETYAETIISSLTQYADEDLTDEIFEILENGTIDQKQYAAKYFFYIPDTIAQEKLEEYAFSNNVQLATNCAQALGKMKSQFAYEKALNLLNSNDDFEIIKAVRFLTSYGDKSAIREILPILEKTTLAENISSELPYLMPLSEMIKEEDKKLTLICLDSILVGLGEILPLYQIFDFEIYDNLQNLIEKAKQEDDSQIAVILLRALDKFSTLTENDEYIFDETKDTKEEVKEIHNLLKNQTNEFWNKQKELTKNELFKSKTQAMSALELIKTYKIQSAKSEVIKIIETLSDEQELLLALSTIKSLNAINEVDSEQIKQKIKDTTSLAIAMSFFLN